MLRIAGSLSVIVIAAAIILHIYEPNAINHLWDLFNDQAQSSQEKYELPEGEVLFTPEEFRKYNGEELGPYLAILGRVYDVSLGMQHYGPGGGYHMFSGRDASRSFITGDFSPEGLTDDLSDLTPQQILSLDNWLQFYDKDYKYLGRLIGRYYGPDGKPTENLQKVFESMKRGHEQSMTDAEERQEFPGCNSEWAEGTGGKVWCSTKSGGVEREWPGVPRQLFNPNTGETRCVCARASKLDNPNLREFSGCESTSISCAITE